MAEDTGFSASGMQLGDQDSLEVERMPMGYGCPRAILAVHSIIDSSKSRYIPARIAAGRAVALAHTTRTDSWLDGPPSDVSLESFRGST